MSGGWWFDLEQDTSARPSPAQMRETADQLMAECSAWLAQVDAETEAPRAILTVREALDEWLTEEQTEHQAAVLTGWDDLDRELGRPIRHGELVLVAARPGVGKTWGLQAWLEATLAGDPSSAAVIFEFEMLAWHLAERLAAHALEVNPTEARRLAHRGEITSDAILERAPSLERLAISQESLGVEQLGEAIAHATERLGRRPTVVAVDYLGLLAWTGSAGARTYERASENAKALKSVARRERVAIIAAAQMSRGAGDGSTRPTLDDLRDSGVVEEAADRVVALWRPTPIEDEVEPRQLVGVELGCKLLKNRFGKTGGELDLQYDHALRLRRPRYEPEVFPFDLPAPETP